jgi:uncharacterized protein YciI
MSWYLVRTRYDHEKIDPVHEEHIAYMEKLVGDGVLAVAGPMVDGSGGIAIMSAETEDAVWDALNADPFHRADPSAERSVGAYRPNLGFWLSEDAS